MNWPLRIGWRRCVLGIAAVAILALATVRLIGHVQSGEPEIALVIGEPWETMRLRSSAAIDRALPNEIWYNVPKSDARLRFTDPQYGFMTPLARFFTVSYERGIVRSVRMSPQIEPLLLDDALKIVLDLQEQWRRGGWQPMFAEEWPAFADTAQWRAQLQACKSSKTYWQADSKYQTLVTIACFQDDRHPDEERYLITLALAKPWSK
ncbi:hypothetical protein PTE30175_03758 [Pandoraea terrae]|uniref:Uncharacterized protein n=1 Tax=Pandoraea terrae TaxID=1537710 RepID=A0A5E4XFB5_9BURK|nr:hypothetical protein [Pandoraea terrae]VVE35074.1 hypothetical protein PTE30175_03758 [Pandoraea terrae]